MIHYKITDKIIESIENIRSIWWVIEHASIVPEWEQKLKKIARLRSWVFSTRIEWSKITLDEANDLLDWKAILARPRDKKELENYLKVLDYIETKENEKQITVWIFVTKIWKNVQQKVNKWRKRLRYWWKRAKLIKKGK